MTDKNTYETPRMTEYGGFEEITKGTGSKPGDGGSMRERGGGGGGGGST